MSHDQTQRTRLACLERQVRHTRVLACGTALGAATLLISGYAGRSRQVIQAERLELVTAEGVRRAVLGSDSLGVTITLLDAGGRPVGNLRLSDEPRLSVQTGRGREVAGLGSPQVHLLDE